jgi:hypothetical protein
VKEKTKELKELSSGSIFRLTDRVDEAYLVLSKTDLCKYINLDKVNIQQDSVFAASLDNGSIEFFNPSLNVIESHNVEY